MEERMILTKHINHDGQMIIAIIDDELLGKSYETEELQLDFRSKFYSGKKADKEEILSELSKSYMAVCAGDETAAMLIEEGLITRDDLSIIAGVPYIYITQSQQ
jgi:uncharacterized protein